MKLFLCLHCKDLRRVSKFVKDVISCECGKSTARMIVQPAEFQDRPGDRNILEISGLAFPLAIDEKELYGALTPFIKKPNGNTSVPLRLMNKYKHRNIVSVKDRGKTAEE